MCSKASSACTRPNQFVHLQITYNFTISTSFFHLSFISHLLFFITITLYKSNLDYLLCLPLSLSLSLSPHLFFSLSLLSFCPSLLLPLFPGPLSTSSSTISGGYKWCSGFLLTDPKAFQHFTESNRQIFLCRFSLFTLEPIYPRIIFLLSSLAAASFFLSSFYNPSYLG